MNDVDFQSLLDEIHEQVRPLVGKGTVAGYIPELASIDPGQFGMALVTPQGQVATTGSAEKAFSIQSIAKVFTLTLAMRHVGNDLWRRVGREPSGTAFNSLVQLEHENGIPRNPFINAGALVVSDVLLSCDKDPVQSLLEFVRLQSGNPELSYDQKVASSEAGAGHRNRAMAHFLKSFDNLENDADAVLEIYFRHCSLAMSCLEVARCGLYLANGGRDPVSGQAVTTPSQTKYINSLLLTCGTYDAVGDFAYRVGLPGKSGVGGGILAVMPGRLSLCVWSPGLNKSGNSLAGTEALDLFTARSGISIF